MLSLGLAYGQLNMDKDGHGASVEGMLYVKGAGLDLEPLNLYLVAFCPSS